MLLCVNRETENQQRETVSREAYTPRNLRRPSMKRLLFLAPLLFLAGCAQPAAEPAKPAADPAKEEAAIRATDDQWQASIKARDAAKAASFWADDAQVILPGTGVMTGRGNLNKFAEDAFKDKNFNITWK